MLSIWSKTFHTATGQSGWDAPDHWHQDRRPLRTWEAEREIAERRRLEMRLAGLR